MYLLSMRNVDNLASLVASDEVVTFEASRLQDPRGTARWRSSTTSPSLIGSFDSAQVVDTLAVLYCNAQAGDTVRLRLANTEGDLTAAPLLDTGAVALSPAVNAATNLGYTHCLSKVVSTSSLWWRLDFDVTGNSDGYLEIGALCIGARWQPEIGGSIGWESPDEPRGVYSIDYAGGGQHAGGGVVKRGAIVKLEGLTKAEALGGWKPLVRDRAGVGTVVAMLDDDEATYRMDYTYYGRLEERDFIVAHRGRFEVEMNIVEP